MSPAVSRWLSTKLPAACWLLGLDDVRTDPGEVDLVDEATGEVLRTVPPPIAAVSDNGPCYRRGAFAEMFTGDDPLLRHVGTRFWSLQTNGVIETYFGTLKYEPLYRGRIDDGDVLAVEVKPSPAPPTTPSVRTKISPTRFHAMPSGRWQLSWP
jgi:putative transposase